MQGVLVVDKPPGMTSHDVVNQIRRLAKMRRVGHTGTLDPMATGVLVVLLGPATRLSRFILSDDKRYHGTVQLGVATTTYDAEGDITASHAVDVDFAAVHEALKAFRGRIQQVPPMYAAVRHQGKRLYELAREGREVEREPRPVTIYELTVLAWAPPYLTLDIVCSSGTYIRSLAHDLGQVLGCGAHLTSLRRVTSSAFTLEDSYTLDTLRQMSEEGRFEAALRPAHAALAGMQAILLTPEQEQAVRYGQAIAVEPACDAALIQARDASDQLVAVLVPTDHHTYRPTLVLPPDTQPKIGEPDESSSV